MKGSTQTSPCQIANGSIAGSLRNSPEGFKGRAGNSPRYGGNESDRCSPACIDDASDSSSEGSGNSRLESGASPADSLQSAWQTSTSSTSHALFAWAAMHDDFEDICTNHPCRSALYGMYIAASKHILHAAVTYSLTIPTGLSSLKQRLHQRCRWTALRSLE